MYTFSMMRGLLLACACAQLVLTVLSQPESLYTISDEKISYFENQIQNLTKQVTEEKQRKMKMENDFKIAFDSMQEKIMSLQNMVNCKQGRGIDQDSPLPTSQYAKVYKKSIMFSASLSYAKSNFNQKTIPFDKIITKVGAGYNNKTGIFTAPVSGQYLFAWQLTTYSVHVCSTYLSKNGQRVQRMSGIGGQGSQTDLTTASTIIVNIKKGDQVEIKTYERSYMMGDDGTSFTGWKII